jgi:hypothetical protein
VEGSRLGLGASRGGDGLVGKALGRGMEGRAGASRRADTRASRVGGEREEQA